MTSRAGTAKVLREVREKLLKPTSYLWDQRMLTHKTKTLCGSVQSTWKQPQNLIICTGA